MMIGQQFGHYEVESRLGSGGVGEVFLARDLRLDRRVAIKVLSERRVGDERSRARFRLEAHALSRLNHPNIATIFDFDQQDGRDFLVMEYIEGRSLREMTGALPPEEVLRLGLQLAEALVAAHGAGVVHLDLKPGNLMVRDDGRLKVLDFGIARLQLPDDASTDTPAEETGTAANAAGTPPYMAPEQVAAGPVDRRTDIYAAGATLYELATGRRIFDKPRGIGLYESILRDKPDQPSRHNTAIPAPLEDTLMKALEKKPADRHQTAEELLNDLRSCEGTETSSWRMRRGRRWARRELVLIAAGLLVAVSATGYALWPVPAKAKFNERDFVLVGDLENRTTDPLLARTVQEALTIALQQSHYVNLMSRDRVAEALKLMQKPAATIDASIAVDLCRREGIPAFISGSVARSGEVTLLTVTASAVDATGSTLLFTDSVEYRRPEELFTRVDELAKRVRQNLGESLAGISKSSQPLARVTTGSIEALRQYSVAVSARATGDIKSVEGPLLAALALDPDFAMAHLRLGSYYMELVGNTDMARPSFDRAYALRDRVTDREKHFIAAEYFSARQQFEQTRDSLKALTTLYPDDPEFRYELAIAHYALEEVTPAITQLRESIRLSPHFARAHGALVLLLARNNQPQAALEASAEAVKSGGESPYLYWVRGLARAGTRDVAGARRDFENLSRTPGYYAHLGGLQAARLRLYEGNIDRAIDDLAQVVDMTRREGDTTLELVARTQLARAALATGNLRLAREQSRLVLRLTAPATTRPNAIRDAGSLALAVGDLPSARACLNRLDASTPNAVVQAAHLFLAGEIERQQGRSAVAARLLDDSHALLPYYECLRARAQVSEALGDWAGAAASWTGVLAAKGQIIQDGFAPDLELARAGLARANGHLSRKDE